MQLYNCKVRLHGSLLHEVRKEKVTAAEIYVLRTIHGGEDAIADIEHTGLKSKLSDTQERNRLHNLYGEGLSTIDGVKSVNGVFGVAGALPEAMPGVPLLKAGAKKPGPAKAPEPMVDDDLNLATDDDLVIPELEEA
jgi:hypothetical protein